MARDFPAGEDFGAKGHRADVTSSAPLSKFLTGLVRGRETLLSSASIL